MPSAFIVFFIYYKFYIHYHDKRTRKYNRKKMDC